MSKDTGQHPLELELPKKILKKNKGYYLPQDVIDFIKDVSSARTKPKQPVSENDVLVAIVRFYQKASNLDANTGASYDVTPKE